MKPRSGVVQSTPVANTNEGMHSHLATPETWIFALRHYVIWAHAGHRSINTIKLRVYHLRTLARATGLAPFEVTPDDLLAYLGSKAWGKTTRHSIKSSLRSFYAWALFSGHVKVDPTMGLPTFTPPRGRPRPAPESALDVGLSATDPRVRLMVELAARSGMRCGEICQAHTDDLIEDLMGWSILVHGKGGKERVVELNDHLAVALRALPTGYLFPGQIDGHLSASYVSKLVSRALPEGWTAHTLRHRFATVAYAADRDIIAIMELLGHASVATTQIYTAAPGDARRRAVAAAA